MGFLAAHNDVVLRTCRIVLREHDSAMDAYAFVLEALRADNYQRLRAFKADGTTRFAVWLVVVTRRLALDFVRRRYGRSRSSDPAQRAEHETRRRLEGLLAAELEPEQIPDGTPLPDAALRHEELLVSLRRSLDELSPHERLLLTMRFADERSAKEIARILRLPSMFHVYRQLTATLARLKSSLRRRGVEDAGP